MRGLIAGLVVLLALTSCTDNEQPEPAPAPAPSAEPTEPVGTPSTEPAWDPRDVDDLPAAADEVAPGLPAEVEPPKTAPLLEAKPMDAAVLSLNRRGGRIQLLGVDGTWREIRSAERYPRESLSPDGTRLVVLLSKSMELWDLPAGERTALPLPDGYRPWDFSWVDWIDDSTVLLDDYGGGWRIDLESGAAERTPYPRWNSAAWLVDDDGALLEVAGPSNKPAILDWSDGSARRIDLPGVGHLQRAAARGDVVIGTTYDDRGFAVVAFDRSSPATATRLPVNDYEGNYSNWAMRAVAVLDDGSGLFWVAVPARRSAKDGWRLVRWTPGSDRFELVTTSEADPTWQLTVARDLVVPEQGPWDPRDVDDLPEAAEDVAPLLPEVLEVPASAPDLAEQPIEAAVLTVRADDGLYLLSVDGSWRRVPPPPLPEGGELTRDGTRLAVQRGNGVDVWDLPTGRRKRVLPPPDFEPWLYPSWHWVDNDSLLLDGAQGGWRVDTITGAADEVPYPREGSFYWTIDATGAVVESADWDHPNVLTDWGGGVRRRIDMAPTGRLSWVQADRDTIVGTSYDNGPLSVYVADRLDLTPREVLRVVDPEANYSNGALSVVALLTDGTVLMRVTVSGRPTSWRLVAWEPGTDRLSVVTRTNGTVPLWSLAYDLLG